MIDDDFGFSAVSEDELVSSEQEIMLSAEAKYRARLKEMYDMVLPLLNNLQKNPEKEYIKWPNRAEKIEQFKLKLKSLVDSR
jgi:hypothetical protein